ncbi:MAG: AMP-binding protein, partial [Lentisphaerota bacterium]
PNTYEEFVSQFKQEIPEQFNFAFDVVDLKASESPKQRAMIHIDNEGRRADYDLGFFRDQSDALAAGLCKRGIGKGDRVVLMLYRRAEFWTVLRALHKVGAVAVPLPSMLTVKDLEYRLKSAHIKALFTENSLCERVDEAWKSSPELLLAVRVGDDHAQAPWVSYDTLSCDGDTRWRQNPKPGGKDTAVLFFSSGTSGEPKMVAHKHEYALGHIMTALYWHDLRPGDVHLTVADTGWAKSFWGKLYGQWMAGATVFVYDFRGRFNAENMLQMMARHKVTTFCAPPTTYRLLIHQDLHKFDLSALRHCTSAGELLNHSVFDRWKAMTGLSIYEGYGQTETTLQVATFPFMTPKPGSMGRPVPGWQVELLDEQGQPVPAGEEGEICVRLPATGALPGLFSSYLDDPILTKSVMKPPYYYTGDKARMDEDGYFWFVGRRDDIIKSSGYRIGPFEVESALLTHPAVLESAVTGMPDPMRGQVVKASVVLSSGYEPSEKLVHELQAHVKAETAFYKYPRVIEFVKELPKTISGKIKRAEIRKIDAQKSKVGAHHDPD